MAIAGELRFEEGIELEDGVTTIGVPRWDVGLQEWVCLVNYHGSLVLAVVSINVTLTHQKEDKYYQVKLIEKSNQEAQEAIDLQIDTRTFRSVGGSNE